MDCKEKKSGEKYWIIATRAIAFVIMFLPFLPNSLWYIGLREEKVIIDASDGIFIVVGFILVWGSANLGRWANSLGATLVNKFKK